MLDSPAEAAGAVPAPGPEPRRHAPESIPGPAPGSNAPSLPLILAVLRRRKLPLIACVMLVPLLALLAIRRVTPRYTAEGALIYEPSLYKVRELQSILQPAPTTEALMASQAEILQSLHIAQKVAERGNLFADPEFNRALRPPGLAAHLAKPLRRLLGAEIAAPSTVVYGPALDPARSATLVAVKSALHATPLQLSHVIRITFTAEDPLVAAAAVNNAMDAYVRDQFAAKHRAVDRATAWLERRASELRRQVRDEEDRIAQYRADKHLSEGMHATVYAEQITHLTEDLVRARGELATADGRLDAARGKAGATAQAAIAPSVVQLRARLDELATQAQAQRGRLGPDHPEAESLHRQIAATERAVNTKIGRVVAATEAERRAAAQRVADAEANLKDAQAQAARAAEAQIPLNALLRDAEAARSQLQAVLERIQQSAEQEAIETSEAHEISVAQPPQSPSSPRIVPLMAGATASGVMFGLLTAYVLHLTDTTLQSGEDARAAARRPCFALLPEISRRARGHLPVHDYAARRPLTAFAEQIRALRTGLWLGADRPRVVAITAA
ncbi:MAG TPA: GumC family protein, partial [Acetobacteraceae bacterium]